MFVEGKRKWRDCEKAPQTQVLEEMIQDFLI